MIPSATGFLTQNFEIQERPNRTYKIQIDKNMVRGRAEEKEAVRQAVYKILNTERYHYPIYSWDYGVELSDLYGEPVSFVCPELERRITEALVWDERIQCVDNFSFDFSSGKEICVSFTVHTEFGDINAEKEVNLNV